MHNLSKAYLYVKFVLYKIYPYTNFHTENGQKHDMQTSQEHPKVSQHNDYFSPCKPDKLKTRRP